MKSLALVWIVATAATCSVVLPTVQATTTDLSVPEEQTHRELPWQHGKKMMMMMSKRHPSSSNNNKSGQKRKTGYRRKRDMKGYSSSKKIPYDKKSHKHSSSSSSEGGGDGFNPNSIPNFPLPYNLDYFHHGEHDSAQQKGKGEEESDSASAPESSVEPDQVETPSPPTTDLDAPPPLKPGFGGGLDQFFDGLGGGGDGQGGVEGDTAGENEEDLTSHSPEGGDAAGQDEEDFASHLSGEEEDTSYIPVEQDTSSTTSITTVPPSTTPSPQAAVVDQNQVKPTRPQFQPPPTASPNQSPSPSSAPSDLPSLTPIAYATPAPSSVPSVSSPSQNPAAQDNNQSQDGKFSDGGTPETNISLAPSDVPSQTPSDAPSSSPTNGDGFGVKDQPLSLSDFPSMVPSSSPSGGNGFGVKDQPLPMSDFPSMLPSSSPTNGNGFGVKDQPLPLSDFPSMLPSDIPSMSPSLTPSQLPTLNPTTSPSTEGDLYLNMKDLTEFKKCAADGTADSLSLVSVGEQDRIAIQYVYNLHVTPNATDVESLVAQVEVEILSAINEKFCGAQGVGARRRLSFVANSAYPPDYVAGDCGGVPDGTCKRVVGEATVQVSGSDHSEVYCESLQVVYDLLRDNDEWTTDDIDRTTCPADFTCNSIRESAETSWTDRGVSVAAISGIVASAGLLTASIVFFYLRNGRIRKMETSGASFQSPPQDETHSVDDDDRNASMMVQARDNAAFLDVGLQNFCDDVSTLGSMYTSSVVSPTGMISEGFMDIDLGEANNRFEV